MSIRESRIGRKDKSKAKKVTRSSSSTLNSLKGEGRGLIREIQEGVDRKNLAESSMQEKLAEIQREGD